MRKTSALGRASIRRSPHVRVARHRPPLPKPMAALMECQWLESFVRRNIHDEGEGEAPRTGNGLPGADAAGVAEGATAPDFGEAAGVAVAFGCVPGGAGGGLIAPVG